MENGYIEVILHSGILVVATVISAEANILLKLASHGKKIYGEHVVRFTTKYTVFGILLSAIAGLADLLAMRFVPFSVKACISSLLIPITAVLARMQLGESASRTQWLGIITAVAGTSGGIICASHKSPIESTSVLLGIIYSYRAAILASVTLPLFLVSLRALRAPAAFGRRSLLQLAGSAYATSFVAACASLSARFVSMTIHEFGIGSPIVWGSISVMVVLCVVQMLLMATMLEKFEATVCVPTYQIFNTVWLAVISSALFLESPANAAGFVGSILLSTVGICFIASASYKKSDENTISFEPLSIIEELSPIL